MQKLTATKVFELWKWMAPYFGELKGQIVLIIAVSTCFGLGATINIHLLQRFLDSLVARDHAYFWTAFSVFIGSTLVYGIGGFLHTRWTVKLRQRLSIRIKEELFKKFNAMSLDFFLKNPSGQLLNQMNGQTGVLVYGFQSLSLLIQDLFLVTSLLWTAYRMQPHYTLYALVFIPPMLYGIRKAFAKVNATSKKIQDTSASANQSLMEMIYGIRIVRVFQGEQRELQRFQKDLEENSTANIELNTQLSKIGLVNTFLNFFGGGLVFYLGGQSVMRGEMTIGSLIAFTTALGAMYGPFTRLLNLFAQVQQMAGTSEKLFATMATPPSVIDGKIDLNSAPASIAFQGVAFKYGQEGRENHVLNDVEFIVRPGDVVAILGPNGSGKSTLLNLLPRLYDPTSGSISLNGVDLREYTLESLRSKIAMVAQESFLFDDTVYNNIAYAKPGCTQDEVELAARLSRADEFIAKLPNGFQTRVGEKGAFFSEGQKQRIAIARAFLKDAPIIILDEPTSALDMVSKDAVTAALRDLMKGRMAFVVTHQPEVLPQSVRVFRLDHTHLVEETRVLERAV